MANRMLAYATDAEPTMHESGQEYMEGMWESVTIERSAAGQPGILIIMERRDGDLMEDQMCVTVKDGASFLAPVIAWLSLATGAPQGIPAPTAAAADAFKRAWHDADMKGLTGARVEAGLVAALQEMFGFAAHEGSDTGRCGGCRDLGPHRNVPDCDYYKPEPGPKPEPDAPSDRENMAAIEAEATSRWGEFASTDTRQGAFERDAFVAGARWALSRSATPGPLRLKFDGGRGSMLDETDRIVGYYPEGLRTTPEPEWEYGTAHADDPQAVDMGYTLEGAQRRVAQWNATDPERKGIVVRAPKRAWEPLPVGGETDGKR